ncbi:MAG: hypothetical protein M1820_007634 [Bogoriella megaspora]|nr:MAG: hypothetical protein M1820_007634 [Bogoriella megaspora]
MNPSEAELESFRKKWREEVSARARGSPGQSSGPQKASEASHASGSKRAPPAGPSASSSRTQYLDGAEEWEPRTYHDLPNKEDVLRLAGDRSQLEEARREPKSALEHYEKAVERETQGNLGDSVKLYRQAFRLDSSVHEKYKNKHFPPLSFAPQKPTNPNPSNASATVPNTAHHSLHGLPPSIHDLINSFSDLSIPPAEPPTSASPPPPCPIAFVPSEIMLEIFLQAALTDLSSFARLPQVCKRFAYLTVTSEQIWRRVCLGTEYGFAGMHYRFACDLLGRPLHEYETDTSPFLRSLLDVDDEGLGLPSPLLQPSLSYTQSILQTTYSNSWRQVFRSRPRIRFNGCYISTVNYTRPGAPSNTASTWHSPVLIVTYYRYLRFYRDGTAISLLTTAEPADVVHHLHKENIGVSHNQAFGPGLAAMKDALRGRWRISGPVSPPPTASSVLFDLDAQETETQSNLEAEAEAQDVATEPDPTPPIPVDEPEGDLHVETEGVVPKYMWKMQFGIGSAGKWGAKSNKLAWKGFWSWNRLTDDWGEFRLKNDRPFYWSRVRSWV